MNGITALAGIVTELVATEGTTRVMYQIVKATGPKYVSKSTRIWTKIGVTAVATAVGAAAAKNMEEATEGVMSGINDIVKKKTSKKKA